MKKNTPRYVIVAAALAVASAFIVPGIAQESNREKSPIFPEVSGADGKMSPEDAAKLKKKKGGKKHPGKKAKKK